MTLCVNCEAVYPSTTLAIYMPKACDKYKYNYKIVLIRFESIMKNFMKIANLIF